MTSMGNLKPSGRFIWLIQAFSGAALMLLAGLHWIAQHYVASGGLRDYAAVVGYLRNPLFFLLEAVFLVVVTLHALLGVRAILMDFGPGRLSARSLDLALLLLGLLTVGYGIFLTLAILYGWRYP
jgi:succinate dehydrogenase hydrophobic anchor subunit